MSVGVYNFINIIRGAQPSSMLSVCTITIINVTRVNNHDQCYHGVQLQYYQGCTITIINVIKGVQPLSMLSVCTTTIINVIRVYNLY